MIRIIGIIFLSSDGPDLYLEWHPRSRRDLPSYAKVIKINICNLHPTKDIGRNRTMRDRGEIIAIKLIAIELREFLNGDKII